MCVMAIRNFRKCAVVSKS